MIRLRALAGGVGRALAALRRRPGATALAIGVVAAALFLFGAARLAAQNAADLGDRWGRGAQMVVYLEAGTPSVRAHEIAAALASVPAIERVDYVAEEDALARLRATLGDHQELTDGIEPGMLPASLEVTLAGGVRQVAAAHPIVARLRTTAGVEEVEFLGGWVERVGALVRFVQVAGWVVLALVGLFGAAAVAATLRLRARQRRREVQVYELLGASGSFIRGPMLLEGLLTGAAGAIAACAVLWLAFQWTSGALEAALSAAFGTATVSFFAAGELVELLALGAVVGLIGSALATGRRAFA